MSVGLYSTAAWPPGNKLLVPNNLGGCMETRAGVDAGCRRDSSVDIATGYGLDGWGSIPDFFFSVPSRPAWEPTQHPIQ
jgi:hypothetical protein